MRNIFKYLAAADLSIATAVSSRLSRKCATMSSGRCSASVSPESVPWEAFGKKGGPGKVGILEGNLAIESILQYYNIDPYEYFEMHEEETAAQSSRHYAKRIPKSKPLVNYEDSEDSDLDTTEVAENVGTGTPTVVFNMNKKNGPAANQGTESDSDSSVTIPYDDNSDMSLSELIQKDREMIKGDESSEEN